MLCANLFSYLSFLKLRIKSESWENSITSVRNGKSDINKMLEETMKKSFADETLLNYVESIPLGENPIS